MIHHIPQNTARTPHVESGACWCQPVKSYSSDLNEMIWTHRGELLTSEETRRKGEVL
jgi:hypothetical protein